MSTKYGTQDAINFLLGNGTDGNGRTIQDYFKFSKERWEECHDHIQWAFPTDIPSAFNANAPIVDREELTNWLIDASAAYYDDVSHDYRILCNNLSNLLKRYYDSIGFKIYYNGGSSVKEPVDTSFNNIFDGPDNHNFRRLTRVIRCMYLFDNFGCVHLLKHYLFTHGLQAAARHSCLIHPETVWHWYNAASDNYIREQ